MKYLIIELQIKMDPFSTMMLCGKINYYCESKIGGRLFFRI
jgi:hypothetical protein